MKIKTKDYELELTIEELKEWLINSNPVLTVNHTINTTNKSSMPISSHNKAKGGRPPILDIEQIKQIKTMAQDGIANKEIAERLKIPVKNVYYWRKNTPKELVM